MHHDVLVETRTPIWTGDIDGSPSSGVLATSILGGLRWWYEWVLRGGGTPIADPVVPPLPLYDPEVGAGSLDRASRVFGATGWRRRFRLVVEPVEIRRAKIRTRVQGYQKPWYFKHDPIEGKFLLRFVDLGGGSDAMRSVLETLSLVGGWAALGARGQMGFGVVQTNHSVRPAESILCGDLPQVGGCGQGDLPSLCNSYFARLDLGQSEVDESETFAIKQEIRGLEFFRRDRDFRHWYLGTVQGGKRIRSKVAVSRPYRIGREWKIRVWGWFPKDTRYEPLRGPALQAIHQYFRTSRDFRLSDWREFDSTRDANSTASPREYLRKLLEDKQ